jgi:hypothetical protein
MITVLILTAEDDCLGIDFNPATPATTQPLRLSMGTSRATFEAALRTTTEEQRRAILADPGRLVWLYTRAFVQAFASHLELFRREWSILYEPYASKSSAFGGGVHRDMVRQLSKEYSVHLRYINASLDNLRRLVPAKAKDLSGSRINPWLGPDDTPNPYSRANPSRQGQSSNRNQSDHQPFEANAVINQQCGSLYRHRGQICHRKASR